MKIPYNWLKEYIDIDVAPDKLAELLTMAGLSVESVTQISREHVLEIETTANRPDWLSIIGVARELSAMTGKKLNLPKHVKISEVKTKSAFRVRVEERDLCPRYTARIIKNVKVGESPAWLKSKIETMGLRPVNNIVDATNFCMFESGEPMHAFDIDKVSGGEVIIRKAKTGEKISTIDGKEIALDQSTLVIADASRPIAIAGVMGGANTEVTYFTKNILLEAAYFDPVSIRRTSRKTTLSTDSSYRFERKVDMDNVSCASDRAAQLICELAGGEIQDFIDIGQKAEKKRTVTLRYSKLDEVSGVSISPTQAVNILTNLGLNSELSSKESAKFEVPGFRQDLRSEIDLIEEVLRIYGYNNVPDTIPSVTGQAEAEPGVAIEKRAREILYALGLNEIITYSLLSKKALELSGVAFMQAPAIRNPLSAEQEMMRPALATGMLNTIAWNLNRKNKDFKLFELGKVYYIKPDGSFGEDRHICVGICGQAKTGWDGCARHTQFSDIKGICENLFTELGIKNYAFTEAKDARFSSLERSSLEIGGKTIGVCGLVSNRILSEFDIKEKAYILEIDLEEAAKAVVVNKRFEELPKYPSVFRDISILVSKNIANSTIVASAKNAAGFILKNIDLIDRYSGKQVSDDKISLTYRLEYQDGHRTLEDKDVAGAQSKILDELADKFGAKLR